MTKASVWMKRTMGLLTLTLVLGLGGGAAQAAPEDAAAKASEVLKTESDALLQELQANSEDPKDKAADAKDKAKKDKDKKDKDKKDKEKKDAKPDNLLNLTLKLTRKTMTMM